MKSKIIKLKELHFEKLKPGGGSPDLEAPKDIENLSWILTYLKKISHFDETIILILIHNSVDEEGRQTPIPAPSKRFIDSMKVIFGSTSFTYDSTRYNKEKEKLEFLYIVDYENINTAIDRLKLIIEFYQSFKIEKETWKDMFERIRKENKEEFFKATQDFKTSNDIKNISATGLTKLLSEQCHYFQELKIQDSEDISCDENKEGNIKFVSLKHLEKGEKVLRLQSVDVTYINRDLDVLELNFNGKFNGKIPGILDLHLTPKMKPINEKKKIESIERAMFEKYKLTPTEKNGVWVGVIDGGFPQESILSKEIIYDDNRSMGFGELYHPQGNHAENVVSILLWTNKLNQRKANDFSTSPRVHLFNVLMSEDNIGKIKDKVKKIVEKYHKQIRIWNFSSVIPEIKEDNSLSEMCVFFDYIQKKYDVLFVFATGNNDTKKDMYIEAPSGSFRGISVSSVKSWEKEPASYSLIGGGKFINGKPDVSIFGGDRDDKICVISNSYINHSEGGTSFAAPLVTRKVAQLFAEGISLNAIPAILVAVAGYHSRNEITTHFDKKIGFGVVPMNSEEIFELINNKAMIVLNQKINGDYSQGFFKIRIPKYDKRYDQNFYFGINIDGTLEKIPTYEYVKDCTRISFGRIDPFEKKLFGMPPHSSNDEEGKNESSLRKYRGKFKTRDVFRDVIKQPRLGTKTIRKSNEAQDVEFWGIKVVRNIIGSNRKKVSDQEISLCIIVDCIHNQNFYKEFISINNHIIQNIEYITDIGDTTVSDGLEGEIVFK